MHHAELLGKLAAALAFVGLIPYIRSILEGKTKPNRASWLIWVASATILLFSYHSSGATTTIWLAAAYALIPAIIFLLSIKYGVGGYTKLDVICMAGALIGLMLWVLTDNPVVALYVNIAIDALGFMPTIKKAYLQPGTENTTGWFIGGMLAASLNVLALTTWELKIALYPIFLLIANTTVAVLATGMAQKYTRTSKLRSR